MHAVVRRGALSAVAMMVGLAAACGGRLEVADCGPTGTLCAEAQVCCPQGYACGDGSNGCEVGGCCAVHAARGGWPAAASRGDLPQPTPGENGGRGAPGGMVGAKAGQGSGDGTQGGGGAPPPGANTAF